MAGTRNGMASQGNPQLRRGNGAVEMHHRRLNAFGALLAVMYHLLDAGLADRHQRKFGRHEEAIHGHE